MSFKETVRKLALNCGFKLKEQPNGEMDLNPYVYDFASALVGEYVPGTTAIKIGSLVKVTHIDEVDRMVNGVKLGDYGVLVKIGPAGYHTIYFNETQKAAVLYASQFEVQG